MVDTIEMFYLYILKLSNGTYYKGQTEDLEKRIFEHRTGKVQTTRNKLPFKLIHVELCSNRIEVRNLEKYFKSGFGREIIHELVNFIN